MNTKEDTIYFARTKESAVIPSKSEENAGYDIYACFDEDYIMIEPMHTVMIPTGIATAFDSDWYCQVQERGSTGTKGMKYGAGVIDSGYRGEWFIPITNCDEKPLIISKLEPKDFIEKHCNHLFGGCYQIKSPNEVKGWNVEFWYNAYTDDIDETTITYYPYKKAIAQFVVLPVPKLKTDIIPYEELKDIKSERGEGALGSTNK